MLKAENISGKSSNKKQTNPLLLEDGHTLFASLFETITEPAFLIDKNGTLQITNKRFEKQSALFPCEKTGLISAYDIFRDDTNNLEGLVENALTNSVALPHSVIWQTIDGPKKVIARATCLRPRNGQRTNLILVKLSLNPLTPISKFKNLNHDLQEARAQQYDLLKLSRDLRMKNEELFFFNLLLLNMTEQAATANREKTKFLNSVTHELRTPLNAILGFSEMINLLGEHQGIDDKILEYVSYINNAGKHLLDMVNDILDIAKIENGKIEYEDQPIEIEDVIQRLSKMLKGQDINGQINIHNNFRTKGEKLNIDTKVIKQILINLIGNAIKYNKHNGDVFIKTFADNRHYCVQIKDTGIGMTAEQLANCIKPYEQVSETLDRRLNGTGLGLSIVHGLIHRYKANMDITSELGVGTTITLCFPSEMVVRD
jgi:signal transduction histidine kinase